MLKNVLPQVFSVDQQTTVESICDEVRKEWQVYQCESDPQEFYVEDKVTPPIQNQDSYWKVANESAGLEIHYYWCKIGIGSLKDDAGNPKHPHLFSLVRCVLSISHGNSVPERGFSYNKYLLSLHGGSTSDETIIALRLVKDSLLLAGGIMNFPINSQ